MGFVNDAQTGAAGADAGADESLSFVAFLNDALAGGLPEASAASATFAISGTTN